MEVGSYMLLAPGMALRGVNGEELGTITEVVADENADIFRGIVVRTGIFGEDIFVPGEYVTSVAEVATASLTRDTLASLRTVAEAVP